MTNKIKEKRKINKRISAGSIGGALTRNTENYREFRANNAPGHQTGRRGFAIKAALSSFALFLLLAAASATWNVKAKEHANVLNGGGATVYPAILTTTEASRAILVYADPVGAPENQSLVQGLPADAVPHGLAYAGNDTALIGDFNNSRIFVVRPSDATLVDTISTAAAGYNGSGTIAVPPQQDVALAMGSSSLKVIHPPYTAASTITSVALPGSVQGFQTHAIVFNADGRAFIRHSTGISVVDAPYTSVAFTIPINTGLTAGIAITPDGNTLLATGSNGITSGVFIFSAPYSAASIAQNLSVVSGANGIRVTPDGTKAIVVSNNLHVASAISAPFGSSSNVQSLPLPAGTVGFEHVDISPDGQSAILAGRSDAEPPILIRAPFTNAGGQSSYIPVNADNPNRGGGGVEFIPPFAANRAPYDFDGDGRSDLSVYRPMADPSANYWYIHRSSDGASYRYEWGIETDRLATADYDGDGRADLAVWRDEPGDQDKANFYILNSSDNSIRIEQFGRTGDNPSLVGDWDGDGKADPAVYREGPGGVVYYRPSSQPGVDFTGINWGSTGDRPVRGDFDGDGELDAAVFRPSDSTWYILQSSNGQPLYINWGAATDKLVPADYDGDGKTDVAIFRDGTWYILQSQSGQPRFETFGTATDILVPADYDGDGRTDLAVYRDGIWYIAQSSLGFTASSLGLAGDRPVAGR